MSIAPYEPPTPLPASLPGDEQQKGPAGWVARLRAAAEIAGYIGDTPFVPDPFRGKPAEIAAAILYGAEVGLEPMQSLNEVSVIRGTPSLSAQAQRALIEHAGHELRLVESTVTRCVVEGRRRDSDRFERITWTLDDAKRAGIAGGENWRRYPAEMLRARASSALARFLFADVVGGMPATEELDDEPQNGRAPTGELPEPEVEKPKTSRSRQRARTSDRETRAAVPATPMSDAQPEPEKPSEPLATDAQKRRVFATMRDLGLDTTKREDRLTNMSVIVGRKIASTNELTLAEAGRLIDGLEALKGMPAEERERALLPANERALLDEARAELNAKDATPPAEHDADDIPF